MTKNPEATSADRLMAALFRPTTWLASTVVAVLCLNTVADTTSRTLGGGSIPLVFDLNEALLIALIFLGLGYAQLADEHIAFTLLYRRMGPRSRKIMLMLGTVFVTAVVVWTAWESWLVAEASLTSGERSMGIAGFPSWPARLAIVVGLALLSIVLIRQSWQLLRGREITSMLKAVDREDM